ncbi:MAG TPA: FHA domain-containing protein [Myxococcota bacterium]|nr:FHA domain-containing protein [Myxococcota bacterium]
MDTDSPLAFIEYLGQRELTEGTTATVVFEAGARFEIATGQRLIIGRGKGADILIQSNRIARAHAAVFLLNDHRLVVVDLETTNGTYVNGEARPVSFLASGDEFWLGDLFGFRAGGLL